MFATMITRIALKELKELLREGRFRLMGALAIALLLAAVAISHNYYQWVNRQHTEAKENARNVWVSQDNKNPHSAAHYGTYAFKPKYPLSLIDQGVDKYAGISIYLEAHKRNDAQYLAAQDQTAISRFADLTPDFILLSIMPLFIILAGFNAFTREREGGTLRLLKAQAVSSATLAAGKWLALFLVVAGAVLLVFLLVALFLSQAQQFGEFKTGALALLFLFYLVYYAVFINITLTVSARAGSSAMSLVVLLAVWIVACLGMPKVSSRLAEAVSPYPTQSQFAAAIQEDERTGLDGHDPFSTEAKQLEAAALKQYGVDSVQQLPFNWDGYLLQKSEEHTAEIYFKHYRHLKETHEKQNAVYAAASVLSPYLPTRFLSMALCRTDYASHWHFSNAAEEYRLLLMNELNMHFAENSTYGDWGYQADKSLWQKIPDFTYVPAGYAETLRSNTGHIGILLFWLLGSAALLLWSVKTMRVF
jgi:ABC-2 type transport system permease protein